MSELEERNLRDMLEQAAGEPPRWISLDSIRRRAIHRRVSQAAVAGLAAIAVGVGATLSAYAAHSGPPAVNGNKTPAGPPKYYVQQDFGPKSGEVTIAVRARTTGKVTSIVRNPQPKFRCGDGLAAAGAHTFFMSCSTWTTGSGGSSTVKATLIYRFEVNDAGLATTPTLLKGGILKRMAGNSLAASPDGSEVAIEATPPNPNGVIYTNSIPIGIFVINTTTGKRVLWRTGPYVPGKRGYAGASDVSFSQNGSELVLLESLCPRTRYQSNCHPGLPREVRAFGPAGRGGSLQGGQILLRLSAFKKPRTSLADALITPDGTALTSVIFNCPKRGVCTVTVARIALTSGRVLSKLYQVHTGTRSGGIYMNQFASDPTGRFLILNAGVNARNKTVNGWIDHGRLIRLTPADSYGKEAW
jgi:hypothetical protein